MLFKKSKEIDFMNTYERIKEINLFLFDMDGTLYLGNRLFDFTRELLDKIKKSGENHKQHPCRPPPCVKHKGEQNKHRILYGFRLCQKI